MRIAVLAGGGEADIRSDLVGVIVGWSTCEHVSVVRRLLSRDPASALLVEKPLAPTFEESEALISAVAIGTRSLVPDVASAVLRGASGATAWVQVSQWLS